METQLIQLFEKKCRMRELQQRELKQIHNNMSSSMNPISSSAAKEMKPLVKMLDIASEELDYSKSIIMYLFEDNHEQKKEIKNLIEEINELKKEIKEMKKNG